jgi:hypothetical protein
MIDASLPGKYLQARKQDTRMYLIKMDSIQLQQWPNSWGVCQA